MPETIRPEKNYLAFNNGLNTESSEIQFPDGFSTDEQNYELLLDGSRQRRRGLAQEQGGSDKTTTNACNGANQSYTWKNVGGDPTKTFIVHKFGSELYFTNDAETISTTYHANVIDLDDFAVTGASVSMDSNYAQFASGRGYLLVSGTGIEPIAIEWQSGTDDFKVTCIYPEIRDYSDQDDGFTNIQYPTALSSATYYNLLNRGWNESDVTTYFSGASQYPNKSVPWYKGYARQVDDVTYVNEDGVKIFSHAKYTGEPPSASSAPMGSLILTPRDSTTAGSQGAVAESITGWTFVDNGSTWAVTITTANAHGLGVGVDIQIKDLWSLINTAYGFQGVSWAGTYTTEAGTTGSTIVTTFNEPSSYVSMQTRELRLGSVTTGTTLTRDSGSAIAVGPSSCAFHDGRLFFAGINDNEWSDYVFFSQIPDKIEKFARCYQVADPTDPENNQLVDTDGGWFVIQGIQGVQRMLSVRGALLVFADNGVWEVSGGQRGFFTPSGYSVRKVTDAGCNSPLSPIAVQNTAFYTGPEGVFRIAPNQYTGVLEANSVSKQLIQTKWNAIVEAEQRRVMSVYDDSKQRVLFLYGKNTATGFYDEILILDIEIPAWYYYKYNTAANTGIMSAYPISYTSSTEQANKIKFSCNVTDTTTVRTCDHGQTDYIDFDGAESPLPYVVTGWDNLGDFQRRRQAPIVTVYAKRTETGYTSTGSGWQGNNESSNLMTAYWDWTDDSVSGKIGQQQQTYRHTRAFTPADANDVDGYPVVVTRNKVRGRGRVLQLRFDGEATKDSHILGFTTNYKVVRAA